MQFLPDPATMAAYLAACVILFITPGPDMSLWLARTIEGGPRVGLATVLGTTVGCLAHTTLAALGLSALLTASATAFGLLKIAGAMYLLWLAAATLRSGSSLRLRARGPGEQTSLRNAFVSGAVVNLSNPKVVLFFVTFLPQFVSASDAHAAAKLFFLGSFMAAFNLALAIGLVFGAQRFVDALKRRPRVMRIIDYVFASVFGGFAVSILATSNR